MIKILLYVDRYTGVGILQVRWTKHAIVVLRIIYF